VTDEEVHRLLVIDDNPDYRALVRYALARSPIQLVGEAVGPAEGVPLAAELQPDLVLLDIVRRDDAGLAAIGALQEVAPHATIVAVAAYAEHELWGSSPSASVAYLPKSTPPTRLCEALVAIRRSRHDTDDVLQSERRTFPADLRSAGGARRFVAGVLERWGLHELLDSAALLVSELVTNAVIHAHSDVELAVRLRPTRVRIEVVDSARDHVRRRDARDDEQSGRGMALIEALAVAWGIDSLLAGKSVWFEMARSDVAPEDDVAAGTN
jgi:anti-sigma regulatory factor (Ser/Thr protein kinase)/ActR/RegA family two-component response regulator